MTSAAAVDHVVRRVTYGATDAVLHAVHRQGLPAWLSDQLHPERIADHEMDALLTRWPSLRLNTWQTRQALPDGSWDTMFDLVDAHIARAIWSQRQLLEVMVDFWSNHFNVTCPSSDVWDNRHLFDRDTIRPHALGSFSEMLCAVGKAPAMLRYLGNAESSAAAPNENWGRELLELHTVGLAAGYSQDEVHTSALILTGLSVDDEGGQYEWKPWLHHTGPVHVLGFRSDNPSQQHGEAVAMAYLRFLAHHPDTATHLATKLATRFVSDDPPASLVRRLAATYRHHGTRIVPVLQELFASREFADSRGAKLRRPFEDFVATLRALRVQPPAHGTKGIRDLQWMAGEVGQPPLGWYAPNGYPDVAGPWATTTATLGRWNAHMNLAAQWWPTKLTWPPVSSLLPSPLPATYGGLVDALAARLHLPQPTSGQRAAVAGFVGHAPADPLGAGDAAVGWRLPYLAALLLDGPGQVQR